MVSNHVNYPKMGMDHSPITQTFKFENNFSTVGKSPKFSEIVQFGCKISRNVENIVM